MHKSEHLTSNRKLVFTLFNAVVLIEQWSEILSEIALLFAFTSLLSFIILQTAGKTYPDFNEMEVHMWLKKSKCYLKNHFTSLCSVAGNTFRSDKQQILCRFNAFYCRGPYHKIFFYLSVQFDALLLLQSFISFCSKDFLRIFEKYSIGKV